MGFEPTTFELEVQRAIRCATAVKIGHIFNSKYDFLFTSKDDFLFINDLLYKPELSWEMECVARFF